MILYRQTDNRYPFLWETSYQPASRWHGEGEGPVHYLADTPNGAWAEWLRHNEIDLEEYQYVKRAFRVVEVDVTARPITVQDLPHEALVGGEETYPACQDMTKRLRQADTTALVAPSAAIQPGKAMAG